MVCGPAPEPQTSLFSVYPLFVHESKLPVATQAASEGTPFVLDVVGRGVGLDVVRVGVGVVGPVVTPPVHVVPLREKLAGTGLLPVQLPLKPNEVLALVATEPL